MLLARLVTVRPVNALGNEPRPVAVPTFGFDRLLKTLAAFFGRK
jgi:hypothetical protein